MGTDLLVVGLWGAVAAYWLRKRRLASADTIGLFHRELEVLQRATPNRVAPANRLAAPPAAQPPAPPAVAVAVAVHRRDEVRRRRRDVLVLLAGAVLVTLVAAVASGSAVAYVFQAISDVALGGYVYLLYSSRLESARRLNGVRRPAPPGRPASTFAGPYGDFSSYSELSLTRAH